MTIKPGKWQPIAVRQVMNFSILPQPVSYPSPSFGMQDSELMTWDEIRDASAKGVTIASHSHTHRVLKTLDPRSVFEELRASKEIIENEVGREVNALAYPCGSYDRFDRNTQSLAAESGYRLGFSFGTGVKYS